MSKSYILDFWKCFRGHDWSKWESSYNRLPRIVTSSLEYLNYPQWLVRDCKRCGKHETKKPTKGSVHE